MVSVTYPGIDRAIGIVATEIEIVTAERNAFDDFLARISDIPTDSVETPASDAGTAAGLMVGSAGPTRNLEAVQSAYRETVMAVPHYDSEYGEPLSKHLATEVDGTLAGQTACGTVVTRPVLAALASAIGEARTKRERFLTELNRERKSLETVTTRLGDIERQTHSIGTGLRTDTHDSPADALQELEGRCTGLARTRQQTIHGRSASAWSGVDEESLLQYLYVDIETDTPALAALGSCLATIRRHKRQLG